MRKSWIDKKRISGYNAKRKFHTLQVSRQSVALSGRIGNQVRALDGTAAVCAEVKFNDEMSVTGKLGRQNLAADDDPSSYARARRPA